MHTFIKNILSFSIILLGFTTAHAANFKIADLVGKYVITHPQFPVVNEVTITKRGTVTLVEKSKAGTLACRGKAKITENVLESNVTCKKSENKIQFTQRINLKDVTDLKNFSAPVFSSLYDMELIMNFKLIEQK